MKAAACAAFLLLSMSAIASGQFRNIHATFGGSSYYYSWRADGGREYSWDQANGICRSLGMGLVSLETPAESNFVRSVVGQERLQYIWTSGRRSGGGWVWSATGRPLGFAQWSFTGGFGRPQPDNREGNEFCLGILNNFYRDGIQWHDIACHHRKPFICETSAAGSGSAPGVSFRGARQQQLQGGFRPRFRRGPRGRVNG